MREPKSTVRPPRPRAGDENAGRIAGQMAELADALACDAERSRALERKVAELLDEEDLTCALAFRACGS